MCCNPKAPGRKGSKETGTSQPKAQTSRPVKHHFKLGRRRRQHVRAVLWPVHAPVFTYIGVIHTKILERNREHYLFIAAAYKAYVLSQIVGPGLLYSILVFSPLNLGENKKQSSHGYYLFSPRSARHTQATISLFHGQRQKSSLKTEKTASCPTSSGKAAKRYALLWNHLLYISTRALSQHV